MASELETKHLDKRTQARYVARGVLTEKDVEKHLKGLPDLAGQAERLETQQPDAVVPADEA